MALQFMCRIVHWVTWRTCWSQVVLVVNVASKCGYTEGDYAGEHGLPHSCGSVPQHCKMMYQCEHGCQLHDDDAITTRSRS